MYETEASLQELPPQIASEAVHKGFLKTGILITGSRDSRITE